MKPSINTFGEIKEMAALYGNTYAAHKNDDVNVIERGRLINRTDMLTVNSEFLTYLMRYDQENVRRLINTGGLGCLSC